MSETNEVKASIYPLDPTKTYRTPGGVTIFADEDRWLGLGIQFVDSDLPKFFGETLTEIVEMAEVTHTWEDTESFRGGVEMPSYSYNCNGFPNLKPNTPVVMTLTMRYPKGSEAE
jgi:hypothetical protein